MGDDIEIKLFDSMNAAPASQLAVAGWMHGEQSGFGTGELNMSPGYKAFVAYVPDGHEQTAVGVLTWDAVSSATMWVYQAFVLEEHRGKGVFTAMLNEALAEAINRKMTHIQLSTSLKHKHALEVCRKTGFVQDRVVLSLEVPQL